MGLFGSPSYDRARLLEAAEHARARGRRRRAIAAYRQVLAVEPGNAELHGRLGPLLAATGQAFDAWQSFHAAAQASALHGDLKRAMGIYREACRALPGEVAAWRERADLLRAHGREDEAAQVLREGRRRFRGRRRRPQAIHLLRRLREIHPWHAPTVLDLARLLAYHDQRAEALMLLEGLEHRAAGRRLRAVLSARLRLEPTLRNLWRWLRVALGSAGGNRPAAFTASSPATEDHS